MNIFGLSGPSPAEIQCQSIIKSHITDKLKEALHNIQQAHVYNEGSIHSDDTTNELCCVLEAIFLHCQKSPRNSFWRLLYKVSHKDTLHRLNKLSQINTDIGRCRAWIRTTLNEGVLESYMKAILNDIKSLSSQYKRTAYLRDAEHPGIMLSYLQSISSLSFELSINSSLLNMWAQTSLLLSGTVARVRDPRPVIPAVCKAQLQTPSGQHAAFSGQQTSSSLEVQQVAPKGHSVQDMALSGQHTIPFQLKGQKMESSGLEGSSLLEGQMMASAGLEGQQMSSSTMEQKPHSSLDVASNSSLLSTTKNIPIDIIGELRSMESDDSCSTSSDISHPDPIDSRLNNPDISHLLNVYAAESVRTNPDSAMHIEDIVLQSEVTMCASVNQADDTQSCKSLPVQQSSKWSYGASLRRLRAHSPDTDHLMDINFKPIQQVSLFCSPISSPSEYLSGYMTSAKSDNCDKAVGEDDATKLHKGFMYFSRLLGAKDSPNSSGAKDLPSTSGVRDSPSPVGVRDSPSPVGVRNSPNPVGARNSLSPVEVRNSPCPAGARNSPSRVGVRDSPRPVGVRNSPRPVAVRNSPSPVGVRNSPSPIEVKNSPNPVGARNSPSPIEVRNSPSPVGVRNSPSPVEIRNSISPVGVWDFPSSVGARNSPSPVGVEGFPILSSNESTNVDSSQSSHISPVLVVGKSSAFKPELSTVIAMCDSVEVGSEVSDHLNLSPDRESDLFLPCGNSLSYQRGWSSDFNSSPASNSSGGFIPDSVHLDANTEEQGSSDQAVSSQSNTSSALTECQIDDELIAEYEILPDLSEKRAFLSQPKFKAMIDLISILAREKGLDVQNYQCMGCSRPVGMIYGEPRICTYDASYYCHDCHQNDEACIPARIVHNWDFQKQKVCVKSYEFLDHSQDDPLLKMNLINPRLYSHVPEMAKVKTLRIQLRFLKNYMFSCKQSVADSLRHQVWPKEYYYDDVDLFSVSDLLQVVSGQLTSTLQSIVKAASVHVYNCILCCQKGFICELCNDSKVIYPFEVDNTVQCERCRSLYHKDCKISVYRCPKCERHQRRMSQLGFDPSSHPGCYFSPTAGLPGIV